MAYRSTASFGKRQEFAAIAELLRRGFDVYLTLVDDQQIDCIVRHEIDGVPHYVDIQIKARSSDCNARNAGTFAAFTVRKPRPNFFYIFYSDQALHDSRQGCYWVVPSMDVVRLANSNKAGKNKGKLRIVFTNALRSGAISPRPKFSAYLNNFDLIRSAISTPLAAVPSV